MSVNPPDAALTARTDESSTIDCRDRFCVIGAGPSGLTALKNLAEAGIEVDGFEREDDVGGNWYYGRPCSSVYASTHLISSKRMTEYTDFPMPREYPPYPSHRQVLDYLRDYARHFQLYDRFEFGRSIERVEPERTDAESVESQPAWRVRFDQGPPRLYGGVIVANGHHWDPNLPDYPGRFEGQLLHSHDYKQPDLLQGKRVLVIGAGNSGCDIAVEAAQVAETTHLSLRRGYHFLPKFLFGKPIDSCGERLQRWRLPLWLRRLITTACVRVAAGRPQRYGLPTPDHKLFESHPIVNSQLLYYVGHGRIRVAGPVRQLCGREVEFEDGRREPVDVIICATGYRISFPFLEPQLMMNAEGRPQFFMNAFHHQYDNLFAAGLIQPNSGQWGLTDLQMQVAAAFIQASRADAPEADWFRKRKQRTPDLSGGIDYVPSQRHLLEVEYFTYRRDLERLRRRFQAARN